MSDAKKTILADGSKQLDSEVFGSANVKDGVITGGRGTMTTEEWHRLGVMLAISAMSEDYCLAIGMLFLQSNLEEIAALRSGWREGGGNDYEAEQD